jgi:CHAD domain-containing protein
MSDPATTNSERAGLAFWMQEVLVQCDKAEADFDADAVHDLRTALRRCRSMADGIRSLDPYSGWKKMKRAGKQLFSSLGELRDTHVLVELIGRIAPANDSVTKTLGDFLEERKGKARKIAAVALQEFDRKQWKGWALELSERAERVPAGDPVFAHIALERWQQARDLHHRALHNRSKDSIHQVRIGLKRFRYTLENFLPRLYERWSDDLKRLQDVLGDAHDLDVLWEVATGAKAFPDSASRRAWRDRIRQERRLCLAAYREKMVGRNSLWQVWRAGLPREGEVRPLALRRLAAWSSFQDPDVAHSTRVAELATELFDGLAGNKVQPARINSGRDLLHASALVHDVGRSKVNRGHHKVSARLLRKLAPAPGWSAHENRIVAAVARYHRGALPKLAHKRFAALPQSRRRQVEYLAGILRLACAFDRDHNGQIRSLRVVASDAVIEIRAEGYSEYSSAAEHLAAARHLLELACRKPVTISAPATDQAHAA